MVANRELLPVIIVDEMRDAAAREHRLRGARYQGGRIDASGSLPGRCDVAIVVDYDRCAVTIDVVGEHDRPAPARGGGIAPDDDGRRITSVEDLHRDGS